MSGSDSHTQPSPPTGGKIRPITRWNTPILHNSVELIPSTSFNTAVLDALIADMFATMYAADGAGLAANQIGVDMSVFVYDVTDRGQRSWGTVCNPVVQIHEDTHDQVSSKEHTKVKQFTGTEGCLSFPGILASVTRPHSITVRGVDQRGKEVEVHAEGKLAEILQHEVDHLKGLVYGDHVGKETRRRMDERDEVLRGKGAFAEDWPVGKRRGSWTIVK